MPGCYDQWAHAKAAFEKSKELYPPGALTKLNKGFNLGPALKTFDKADGYEAKAKALMAVRTAKQGYDHEIRAVMNIVKKKDSAAYKALDRLEKALLALWLEADKHSQPPRPCGTDVQHEVVRSFNLAGKVKPKHLDIQATKVDVMLAVDKVLDELIKNGQESLKLNHLGEVAKAKLDKVADDFTVTIVEIDNKIEGLDAKGREAKIKEANEVLKHYARIVEDGVNEAVQKEWQGYQARKKHLSDFRFKCGIKIFFGTVGVGVATASAVLSFGTMWMNIVAIVKGISDLAQTIKTWAADLETVYAGLLKDIAQIDELNRKREAAKKTQEGQKASKAKEMAKEVATGIVPITKNMITSASDVEARAKQLLGLVSKLEDKADQITGQLNAATKQMSKLPEKQMNPAMKADAEKLAKTFEKLFADIADLHRRSVNCGKTGERWLKAAQKLRKEDSWTAGMAESATGIGTKGVALYAAANFGYEIAKHGAQLVSLL